MTSKLESVGSETIALPAIRCSEKLDSLPEEFLDAIFSFLSQKDLQAATLVNRSINRSVKRLEVQNFINGLIQQLNAEIFRRERETLLAILRNVTPQDFVNLRLLKGYILDVQAQLINVIKTLDAETENNLRAYVRLPYFFENIFGLVALERQIDQANVIPNEFTRSKALRDISRALTEAANIEKAIEVARLIPRESTRDYAVSDISEALMQADNIDRAIEVVRSIPNQLMRSYALSDISKALTRRGNIDRAIEVARSIPHESTRGYALSDISEALMRAGNSDRAIEVARSIPDEFMRGSALRAISQALTRRGNIHKAIQVATLIPNEETRSDALSDILKALEF